KNLIEDHELTGSGASRVLKMLLRKELTGSFHIDIVARRSRTKLDEAIDFPLPLADAKHLRRYTGRQRLIAFSPWQNANRFAHFWPAEGAQNGPVSNDLQAGALEPANATVQESGENAAVRPPLPPPKGAGPAIQ
ncbi:unnamed protein product, partial [marine sediment metagenome]